MYVYFLLGIIIYQIHSRYKNGNAVQFYFYIFHAPSSQHGEYLAYFGRRILYCNLIHHRWVQHQLSSLPKFETLWNLKRIWYLIGYILSSITHKVESTLWSMAIEQHWFNYLCTNWIVEDPFLIEVGRGHDYHPWNLRLSY